MPVLKSFLCVAFVLAFCSCEDQPASQSNSSSISPEINPERQTATLAAGCYWCTEAVFEQLKGVRNVESGFAFGTGKDPMPAEACQISYDPDVISFEQLLEVYWQMHDPTTPNRQGADVGPEYRSVVFCHDEKQQTLAEHYKQRLTDTKAFDAPIVTEIVEYGRFETAKDSQQNYYRRNINNKHCQLVIKPKVEKIRQAFADKIEK